MDREDKILVLIIAGAAAYFLLVFNRGVNAVDEGYVLHLSQMIAQGRLPYRDFFYHALPGTLYIQAGLFSAFGEKLIISRAWALLQALVSVWLSFKIARTFQRTPWAYLAPLLYIPWNVLIFYRMAHYNIDSSFFALCALFFLLFFKTRGSPAWLFAAGLSAGLALICKQNVGAFACLFVIIGAAWAGDGKHNLLKRSVAALAGMVVPLLAVILYFGSNSALHDLYQVTVLEALFSKRGWVPGMMLRNGVAGIGFLAFYSGSVYLFYLWIKSAGKGRGFSRLAAWAALALFHVALIWGFNKLYFYPFQRNFITGFFPIIMIAFSALFARMDKSLTERQKSCLNLTLLFFGLTFFGGLLSGLDFAHNLMSFCQVFLLAGYIFQFLSGTPLLSRRLLPVVAGFVIIAGFAFPFTESGILVFHEPWWKATEKVNLPELYGIRASSEMKEEIEGICLDVRLNTAPGDKIEIIPFGSIYYFLAHREPASYRTFLYHDIFPESEQSNLISEIKSAKVRLVIIPARGRGNISNMLDAGYLKDAYQYVYENYFPLSRHGRYEVYIRSSGQAVNVQP